MEPVVFPRPIPATGRAERVNPAEFRRDAGKEQAFRRFLQRHGEGDSGSGEEPGRETEAPERERQETAAAEPAGEPEAAEDPCRGRRIDIRI